MKRIFLFLPFVLTFFACNKQDIKNVSIHIYDDPKALFAVDELGKALAKTNYSINNEEAEFYIKFLTDNTIKPQGFLIKANNDTLKIIGGDASGLMYGGLRLAELLNQGVLLENVTDEMDSPYIKHRGIKLNIPLDARTPSYDDTGDAAQMNIATMWEMDYWKNYLDQLARDRYNLLTLWSLHPYPSWVKVPEYPEVALNDVCVYNKPVTSRTDMKWKGMDIQNPDNLTVIKRISIDEKIEFWKEVFQHAENRGIDIYIFHWNVFVNGAEGKHGIEWSQQSDETINYIRKSIKAFLLTYPTIRGIGVTAGEHVNRNLTGEYGIESWMWKTYGQGVMDARAENPDINVRFIFRRHWSDLDAIKEAFKTYDGPFETSFKYSRARMYSSVNPPWFDKIYRKTVEDYRMDCWLNVRNDDIFAFRWGDPNYASQYIKNMPVDVSPGFYMGPDGYVWGKEVMEKNPGAKPQLSYDKHWYRFMIWGRSAYNPNLGEGFFKQKLAERFPEVDASLLHATWRASSDVISWINKIHFRQNDVQFAPEACFDKTSFHDVNTFINIAAMPEQGVVSIADYAHNQNLAGITPIDVASQLDIAGTTLLTGAERLEPNHNKELAATITDLKAMGYLGKYYANKVLGSTYLAMFRVNGNMGDKQKAVQTLEYALQMWRDYAFTAQINYRPTLLARTQVLDWEAITKFVEEDIQIAKNARQGEEVRIKDDNILWNRDQRRF